MFQGDWIAVCACRVLMGLTQGLLYPSIHGVLGHWAPTAERSRLGTFVYAGAQLGTIIELLSSGLLSASAWGWPSVFYVAGVMCLTWSALWLLLGDSTPGTSRWISEEERKYIESNVLSDELGQNPMPTPWLSILTSLPFWAILLAHCGQNLGFWTLLTELPSYMNNLLTSGLLSASAWGWPSVFYVAGVMCLTWSALWLLLGDSTPGTSRWISEDERKYIENNVLSDELGQNPMPTPWLSILTSLPFWAILLAHCGQNLGFWTLLTELPSYMNNNGKLSALPYVAMYILSFVFSWIADFLVNRDIVQLVTSRKIFNTIAHWGPAVALLGLAYLPAGNLTLAVVILTITLGLNGAHYVGFMLSHIDLSPNHASTLMGITNGISSIFSIMAPLSVSVVVQDQSEASEWRKVFFISIAFYLLSNLFYLLFISGDVQSWNEPQHIEGAGQYRCFISKLFYLVFISGDVQSWNEPQHIEGAEEGGVKKVPVKTKRDIRRLSIGESKF
ncbi:Permease of the major facilitator superfamily [Operophtera brumata]|uniref:Permease of the major facilitator superfamily n=1 Tax=Operophtera brumata TaxID=104452 RepID=A0A0L7KUX3_OPEBR|nr:Permease of the major facilitator superfamily [Operophtera brumata]